MLKALAQVNGLAIVRFQLVRKAFSICRNRFGPFESKLNSGRFLQMNLCGLPCQHSLPCIGTDKSTALEQTNAVNDSFFVDILKLIDMIRGGRTSH